jgi:hypothetical protein
MENFKRINKQGILEKNENDGENFLSLEQYKKEIFPIIEILKPDSLSLEEYEKQVTDELFADIKTIQIARGVLYENPDKIIEEIKDLLNSRLKSVLKDAGDYNAKVKPDKDLVKKAKIALFFENDMTEAKKSSYMGEEKIPKISDLRNYIIGYGEKNKFTESDVDSLMKTKYKKSYSKNLFKTFFLLPIQNFKFVALVIKHKLIKN